jgi:hypothetical protein
MLTLGEAVILFGTIFLIVFLGNLGKIVPGRR